MSKKNKKKHYVKQHFPCSISLRSPQFVIILFICFILFGVYRGIMWKIWDNQLIQSGVVTKGRVIESLNTNNRRMSYIFYYPDWRFLHMGHSSINYGKKDDTIYVIFLEDNPKINCPWDRLKDKIPGKPEDYFVGKERPCLKK